MKNASSSSSSFEVLEIPPPIINHRTTATNNKSCSKQKYVIPHETIIHIDSEEEEDDVVIIDDNVWKSSKRKGKKRSRASSNATAKTSPGRQSFVSPQPSEESFSATQSPMTFGPKKDDEILRKFDAFKQFDIVEDYSDHYFSRHMTGFKLSKESVKRIHEEWKILEECLPDKIFVRAYESRIDLLRAVIVGAEGTPFYNGLYFFDFHFPPSYPSVPPRVQYRSGGKISPNINSGQVCMSLINTTLRGLKESQWISGTSTMLQVLVSIQGLILSTTPLPESGNYSSRNPILYAGNIMDNCLETMYNNVSGRAPRLKHFEDFFVGHFVKHGRDILAWCVSKACTRWLEEDRGVFRRLVMAFSQIGAKDCEEFLIWCQPTPASFNYV